MTYLENIRVARMLKPATPGGLGGSGPRSGSNSSAHRRPSLSPEPPPVSESVFIAAQMRAMAAPFATKLAWILAVLFCALLHENIETLVLTVCALVGNAVFFVLQIWNGSQGGVYDRNVSLFDTASSPSNVFNEALNGDAMSLGVLSSILILICAYRNFILRRVQSAWRTFNNEVNQHVMVMILLGFIWWCVAKASALSEPSMMIQQQRTMLPDVADRLVGSSALVRVNIRWAHSVSEHWFNTTHIDFTGEEEFVGIFGVAILTDALVWDSGARRHVVRAKNRLIPSSIKPCNFTVRGINTGGMQPSWMGDVEEFQPLYAEEA